MPGKYYEAYNDRYQQVHQKGLQWFSAEPSGIVLEVMGEFGTKSSANILEIGCGEGRDACCLLEKGYHVLATDVSPAAIRFCREKWEQWADRFRVLDCLRDRLDDRYDFIYAVAVLHMLVADEDRTGFYRFVARQLSDDGIALIGTMGDGTFEVRSDIRKAFDLQSRTHEQTGQTVLVANTSCRVVTFETFLREIKDNGLSVVKHGITAVEPDFPEMMYAVVKRA